MNDKFELLASIPEIDDLDFQYHIALISDDFIELRDIERRLDRLAEQYLTLDQQLEYTRIPKSEPPVCDVEYNCPDCNIEMEKWHDYLICKICGYEIDDPANEIIQSSPTDEYRQFHKKKDSKVSYFKQIIAQTFGLNENGYDISARETQNIRVAIANFATHRSHNGAWNNSIPQWRQVLSKCNLTHLYPHIPRLRMRMTNREPPRLSDFEREQITTQFMRNEAVFTEINHELSRNHQPNIPSVGYNFHLRMLLQIFAPSVLESEPDLIPPQKMKTERKNQEIYQKITAI